MKNPGARAALSLLVCAPAFVWTADLLADTPPLILAAATLPAALLATLILVVQRGGGRARAALAFALVWGVVGAAFLATSGNELARTWMTSLGGDASRTATAVLVAPALEELSKALGLLLLVFLIPAALRNARDGIVYGALIGVGFVWAENFLYLGVSMLQGGQEGLVRALYLRGIIGGMTHVVFAASSGAAVGWWVSGNAAGKAPTAIAAAGVLFAIAQHIAWNAFAAPTIVSALCGALAAGGACAAHPTSAALFGTATLVAALFLAPGAALMGVSWRRTSN